MSDSARLLEEARHDHGLVLAAVMMTMELTGKYVNAYAGEPAYTHDDYDDAMAALNRLYVKAAELQRLRDALEGAETRRRLEDVMMFQGITALEALYANGHRDTWIAPSVYAGIESAVLGLRAALAGSTAAREEETDE